MAEAHSSRRRSLDAPASAAICMSPPSSRLASWSVRDYHDTQRINAASTQDMPGCLRCSQRLGRLRVHLGEQVAIAKHS
jgi:hypothetical protein